MKKIRNIGDLNDVLDNDLSWRKKEISNMYFIIRESRNHQQATLIRAAIPLLYAHWEGFIKVSSSAYIKHINGAGVVLNKLTSNLVSLALKSLIHNAIGARKNALAIDLIDRIRFESNTVYHLKEETDTKSNLKYNIFEDIAITCGIELKKYETKRSFIDNTLVDARNKIAHGEYLEQDPSKYKLVSDETVELLSSYRDDIINNACLRTYLSQKSAQAVE